MNFNNLLKQANYTLLLPRTQIKPLHLILKKQKNWFQWLTFQITEGELLHSSIQDLFDSKGRGRKLPKITTQKLPKELNGSDILQTNTNFITHLLGKDNSPAKAQIAKADKVLFSFEDAIEVSANLVQLDEYLQFGELNEKLPTFYQEVMQGNIYVITSVLASPKLSISNADDFQFEGSLDASQVSTYVQAKLSSDYKNHTDYQIKYEDTTPIVFAIKTAKIYYLNSRYRLKLSPIEVRTFSLSKEITYFDEDCEIEFE